MLPSLIFAILSPAAIGVSLTGVIVKFIALLALCALTPSVTVKLKLALVVSEPLCTKRTWLELIWFCVKVFEVVQLLPLLTWILPLATLLAVYIATPESVSVIPKSVEDKV